jgi:hypothetical protein
METGRTKTQITFQVSSEYDRTLESFVERVSRYISDYASISYDFSDIRKFVTNKELDLVLGDIIPPDLVCEGQVIQYLIFNLFDYQSVEEIIRDINEEIYGKSLVEIPDENKSYVVKIISNFSS